MTESVAIIGSGNWGSAIARIVGENAASNPKFDNIVKMWVFEELIDGRKLTEIINEEHENVKYLPGVKFPENVVAVPDLIESVQGATILVFVIPHQFLPRTIDTIKGHVAPGAKAISLIKGIDFDDNGIILISDIIRNGLNIDCSVLMGANVANEVARDQFCETTIGYTNRENAEILAEVFNSKYFRVSIVEDAIGVELCGALKNIVALGAGFCDGLGYGGNTKAAIIRIGLLEMMKFSRRFYSGIQDQTYFESCGVADLITTCYGGRNRKCAEAFVTTGKSWDELEAEILNGQKLQGTLTSKEVSTIIARHGLEAEFPLLTAIYRISFDGVPPSQLVELI